MWNHFIRNNIVILIECNLKCRRIHIVFVISQIINISNAILRWICFKCYFINLIWGAKQIFCFLKTIATNIIFI